MSSAVLKTASVVPWTPGPETSDRLASRAYENALDMIEFGRFANAKRALERAAELNPGRPDSLLVLSQLLRLAGRDTESKAIIERALTLSRNPKLAEIAEGIGERIRQHYPPVRLDPARELVPEKPTISMSMLGIGGRFGNQIYQYAFMRLYAEKHGFDLEAPSWVGERLFGLATLPLIHAMPHRLEVEPPYLCQFFSEPRDEYAPSEAPHNIDIQGYFQFPGIAYRPFQRRFRELFTPRPEVLAKLEPLLVELRSRGRTIIACHIRRGDQTGKERHSPASVYLEWLASIWKQVEKPVLFVASEEAELVRQEFAAFSPVVLPPIDFKLKDAEFFSDFWLLQQADIVAIANSSFSSAAAMLNERAQLFMRPTESYESLVPYDPWEDQPLT